jgi:hypothetical protein
MISQNYLIVIFTFCISFLFSCKKQEKNITSSKTFEFKQVIIADSLKYLWAYDLADIDGDGIKDLIFCDNNAHGGTIGFYKGDTTGKKWVKNIIVDTSQNLTFAAGDLETGDIDGDGDIDIIGVAHTGEWDGGDSSAVIYYFRNPDWEKIKIGEVPAFVKDISITDFNNDQLPDIAVLTFSANSISLFIQQEQSQWERKLHFEKFKNIHEGMDVADIDGDSYPDLIVNGHILYNPKGKVEEEWVEENLSEKWNKQDGNWSRNATKIRAKDINGDGIAEIFISHSERAGYPLSWYSKNGKSWQEHIILDSIPACHTIQVEDFNNDGYSDILTGTNRGRGKDLGYNNYEVMILFGDEGYTTWATKVVSKEGIYNGHACDFDLDGDIDFFRYASHDATQMSLYVNMLNP